MSIFHELIHQKNRSVSDQKFSIKISEKISWLQDPVTVPCSLKNGSLMSENWRYLSYDFRLGFNNWGRRFSMKNWVAKFWPKASKDHRVIWISSTLWFIDLNIDKIFNLPHVQIYFTLKCEQWLWFKSFRNIRSQVRIPGLDICHSRDLASM